jgi:AraC-like DNA-binding protein
LFLGSTCIYPRDAPQPLREESLLTGPLEATNEWYAIAKIAGLKLALTWKEPLFDRAGRIVGLSGISRDAPNSSLEPAMTALSSALGHVHDHLDSALRITDLAARAGLSAFQLDQRIRALFGLSTGQYLTRARIELACDRLRQTDMPDQHRGAGMRLRRSGGVHSPVPQVRRPDPQGLPRRRDERRPSAAPWGATTHQASEGGRPAGTRMTSSPSSFCQAFPNKCGFGLHPLSETA